MGSDGGILGIGTPEAFTILLVGYYVLGPSDLFKLTKEIGKFVQNFQTFATEATTTFETSMESQLQLEEIRKAQRELNDAFSFRRSINVDDASDPFTVTNQSPRTGDNITDMPTTTAVATDGEASADVNPSKKKKRIRRIKKKKVLVVSDEDDVMTPTSAAANSQPQLTTNIPSELDMTDTIDDDEYAKAEKRMMDSIYDGGLDGNTINDDESAVTANDAAAQIRKERLERLERGLSNEQSSSSVAEDISTEYDLSVEQQSRYQQQLNGNWNEQILSKNDELEPLAEVMNQLALLEDERIAADRRIQQEFKLREENEEKFYLEKRKLLEGSAAKIQASAYTNNDNNTDSDSDSISDVDASKVSVASSATAATGAVNNDTKKL